MYDFPSGVFTDVRIETEYSTMVTFKNLELKQNKRRIKSGALIRLYDGNRWYYSSITDVGGVQRAIEELASMATSNPDICENDILHRMEKNRERRMMYDGCMLPKVPQDEKLKLLRSYIPVLSAYKEVVSSELFYKDIYTKKRIISSIGTDVEFDKQFCCIACRYKVVTGSDGLPFNGSCDIMGVRFEDIFNRGDKLEKSIQSDINYAKYATPVKPGIYTCILSPVAAGVFAHESFGHKSEADLMLGDEETKHEWKLGKMVGSPVLSIIDTGDIEGSGYVPFDDEGCRAKRNYIIKNGILTGRLHSAMTASGMNESVTGNARATGFEYEPIVRMTTTYIDAGRLTKDELFAGVKEGIFIDDINHGSGMSTFTIAPRTAYMIRNGSIDEPVKISVITGNVMRTLHDIDGLSDKVELLSFATGGCGKMEQMGLPVCFGGPYVRVNGINVL